MKFSDRILLTLRNFWKKNWRYIIIIIIVWVAVFLINNYLKNRPQELTVINTYSPDTPVMDNGQTVPEKYKKDVNETINTYFNYCNNKEYENAYNMLTQDCKEYLYNNNISAFQDYIDSIFTRKKIYNIQNYSNIGNVYIYDIRILDDIMSTGTNGGYDTYEEKIALINNNGEMQISNQGYIGQVDFSNIVGEDEYLKVEILSKNVSYTREEYIVEIRNKTDGYILIGNGMVQNEITLDLGDQTRGALDVVNNNIIIAPGETRNLYILFNKFADDDKEPEEISFNLIRVYNSNVDRQTALEGNSEEAERTYSMNIPLK